MDFPKSLFSAFHPLDMGVTVFILIMAWVGYRRGFLSTVLLLLSCSLSLLVAWLFYARLGAVLTQKGVGKAGPVLAFILLFLLSMVVCTLIGHFIAKIKRFSVVQLVDSVFGLFAGSGLAFIISLFLIVLISGGIQLFYNIAPYLQSSVFYDLAHHLFRDILNGGSFIRV